VSLGKGRFSRTFNPRRDVVHCPEDHPGSPRKQSAQPVFGATPTAGGLEDQTRRAHQTVEVSLVHVRVFVAT